LKKMNKEEIFLIWAPETSVWSPWVKPVLFAHLESRSAETPVPDTLAEFKWVPGAEAKTAIILDLPSDAGVLGGLALAKGGYRPVPLYNAIPAPVREWASLVPSMPNEMLAAVNVLPIMNALQNGAGILASLNIPVDAPPVFLLDANRQGLALSLAPGRFDNRAVCFTTDFPSANFLLSHGIGRVLLVQKDALQPQSDLAHTLCRWQDAGISLETVCLDLTSPPEAFTVSRPSWYGVVFQRALAVFGLRRAGGGGFGAWVPTPGSGG
jgi:hypothetical protein